MNAETIIERLKFAGRTIVEDVVNKQLHAPRAQELQAWLIEQGLTLREGENYSESDGDEVYDGSDFIVERDGEEVARIADEDLPYSSEHHTLETVGHQLSEALVTFSTKGMFFVLDENRRPVAEPDADRWQAWFSEARKTRASLVGQTRVGEKDVVTIFLGYDPDGPTIPEVRFWQTTVYDPNASDLDEPYQQRCAGTWEQAEAMHADIVVKVQKGEELHDLD